MQYKAQWLWRHIKLGPRWKADDLGLGTRLLAILLLAEMLLAVNLVVTTGSPGQVQGSLARSPDIWVASGALVILAGGIAAVELGLLRAASMAYILVTAVIAWWAPFLSNPDSEFGLLAAAAIPVLLASLLLSHRQAAALVALLALSSALQLLLLPDPARRPGLSVALPAVVAALSALAIASRYVAQRLERARRSGRKAWEVALSESEERLRLLIHNSLDVAMVLDCSGLCRFVSESYERVTGFSAREALHQPGFAPHPDDEQRVWARFAELVLCPRPAMREEFRQQHREGHYVWVEVIGSNRLNTPGIEGIVVNLRDISERKQAEEQRNRLEAELRQAQKMEAVGRLAGGIAHDLNNILTPILGYTQLAIDLLPGDAPASGRLQNVLDATERAVALTRQILAFSRKQVLEMTVLDLGEVITNIARLLERLLGEGIVLNTTAQPGEHYVRADRSQIEQVLMNLAINARDAMPQGGTLSVGVANVELDGVAPAVPPGAYVLLMVSDTGEGMDKDLQQRIFEPFFTTKAQGTGLGLATVQGIVKQHGGEITVYSHVGIGTTFRIYLPAANEPVSAPESAAGAAGAAPSETVLRGGTVLVVEDEELVRRTVCQTLETYGYSVLSAGDATECMEVLASYTGDIHLLLADLILPQTNGCELYERVARLRPGIRVLYMSGYAEDVISYHGMLQSSAVVLAKPFTVAELLRKVRSVLN
jgi:two-component system, cell cycle sensor histidine kinase and response regulator CckA